MVGSSRTVTVSVGIGRVGEVSEATGGVGRALLGHLD